MFRKSLILSLLVIAVIAGYQPVQAQGHQQLQGHVVVVPAGRTIDVVTENVISTNLNHPGDRVKVRVDNGFYDNGRMVLPYGTTIEGVISEIIPAGRVGKNASVILNFNSAILPNGKRIPMSARIETEDQSGVVKGGTTKGRVGKMLLRGAERAAEGAVLGTAMGAVSGGSVGKGAAYGTAIGGGIGVVENVIKKGKDVQIPSGAELDLVLTEPLKVNE